MKISTAVDSLTKENKNLRLTVKLLLIVLLCMGAVVMALSNKKPLVVERTSSGLQIVRATPLKRTKIDIIQATKLMLKARFDSHVLNPDLYLTEDELNLRNAEQVDLKSRGITQNIVFRKAQISKDNATVDFDRVLAIGDVRSDFPTVAKIAYVEVEPNTLNPYGLKLALIVPIKNKNGGNQQ